MYPSKYNSLIYHLQGECSKDKLNNITKTWKNELIATNEEDETIFWFIFVEYFNWIKYAKQVSVSKRNIISSNNIL